MQILKKVDSGSSTGSPPIVMSSGDRKMIEKYNQDIEHTHVVPDKQHAISTPTDKRSAGNNV